MSTLLTPGQRVWLQRSQVDCVVDELLGAGGQGEVHRVTMPDRSHMALKWYFPASATQEQLEALRALVDKGAPDDRFLWPVEVAEISGQSGFGYLMALRPSNYSSIVDLMRRRVEPRFRAIVTAGFQLADSFYQLHALGLCYRDISFGNVFFDAATGDITVCDNDNVGIDDSQDSGGVGGTMGFMAPEVVRGEAAPSRSTDLFSLAVLLFYMLMVHHPLEGRRELSIRSFDANAKRLLYGEQPSFIWDPDDDSNRPDPQVHQNAHVFWALYPEFIKELFTRSFTQGVRDPDSGRVQETVWRQAMIRLRDSITYCGACGEENFLDDSDGAKRVCWNCHNRYEVPARLVIDRNVVILNHDTRLYPHHLGELYQFGRAVATVNRHPKDPRRWGLRNDSDQKWVALLPGGEMRDVDPGRSVAITKGTRIQFGGMEGEILAQEGDR